MAARGRRRKKALRGESVHRSAEPQSVRPGRLEPVEALVAREVERLGGIIEGAPGGPQNPQRRQEFEDLLRGCEYTFRGGQLVVFAPHPARAARVRLDSDTIAAAWQRLNEGEPKPAVVVRVETRRRQ